MIYDDLVNKYLVRSEAQTKCTAIFLEQIAEYQELGQTAAETILAASLHVNMLSHDLMALLLLYGLTDDKWTNRTASRMISTVIYEGAEDLPQIFGKPFRDSCSDLGILEEIKDDLAQIRSEMASFKRTHETVLKTMRMTAGAHREHDVEIFLSSFLDESKTTAVVEASVEFETCLRNWGKFCTFVMERVREKVKK